MTNAKSKSSTKAPATAAAATTSAAPVVPAPVTSAAPTTAPAPKKSGTKKSKKAEAVETPAPPAEETTDVLVEEIIAEAVGEESGEIVEDGQCPVTGVKVKRIVTRDTVIESFDNLIKNVTAEIDAAKADTKKVKGTKCLRMVLKNLTILKNQASRLMKKPREVSKTTNQNSGFLKPVRISKEMAKFTGWNTGDKKSRVDVTKFICNYIKDNNLQNPNDRRQINADTKLKKLLAFESSDDNPLTYYKIQTYIKPHFVTEETATA
jgi:chromatin remodeling complex protein RSC6